jgi:hypothetical protein
MTVAEKIEAMLSQEKHERVWDVAYSLMPILDEDAFHLAKMLVRHSQSFPIRLVGDEIHIRGRAHEDATYAFLCDPAAFTHACHKAGCAINW